MGSEDKRRVPRFTMDQMIELNFEKEEFVAASGVNISELGVMCRTSRYLDEGARVFLMFSLVCPACESTIQCEGIVIHCKKTGASYSIGIEFSDLKPADREMIQLYTKSIQQ
jgi:hypothetical protein